MAKPLLTAGFAAFALLVAVTTAGHDLSRKPDSTALKSQSAGINGINPTDFSPEELQELQKRFGVHGPQTPIAQLFTQGVDQLEPLRAQTLSKLQRLEPIIHRECRNQHVNPMLVTAILFDEIQHSKPGEDFPIIVHSGLVKTHGLAQIGIGELIHQNRLPKNPTPDDIAWAREQLLDPAINIELLTGKIRRLKKALGFPEDYVLIASRSYLEAKAIATLTYLHNGKLDYPSRILRYMQDPELHGLMYGDQIQGYSWMI